MKKITILIFLIFLLGCNSCQPEYVGKEEDKIFLWELEEDTKIEGIHKVCLDGVYYWSGYSSLAVAFNQDSTVQTCLEVSTTITILLEKNHGSGDNSTDSAEN